MKKTKLFEDRIFYIVVCLAITAFLVCAMGGFSRAAANPLPALDERAFYSALSGMVSEYRQTGLTAQSEVSDPYITKRLILKSSNPAVDPEDYGAVAAIRDRNGLYILQFSSIKAARRAERQLKEKSGTVYVEPDVIISAHDDNAVITAHSDDAVLTAQSNMIIYKQKNVYEWQRSVKAINADVLGAAVKDKSGTVKVAVLDTGIAFSAPDLTKRIDRTNAISMFEGYRVDQDLERGVKDPVAASHGTHVAGIVAKCTEAVSDKVTILPVRVLDNDGYGYCSIVSAGIRYAADHGAKVINLSLGSEEEGEVMNDAVVYANKCGCSVVVAAGNSNKSVLDCYPSNLEECIVVGAVDDLEYRLWFSNYGSTLDIMAPGLYVYSCFTYYKNDSEPTNWYAELTGTSMAAPHVSGAAAMLMLAYPDAKPIEIEKILQLSAKDLGVAGKDDKYGYGMLDLNAVVQQSSSLRKQAADYLAQKEAEKKAAEEAAARKAAEEEAARKAAEEEAARKAAEEEAARKAAEEEAARKAAEEEAARKAAEEEAARKAAEEEARKAAQATIPSAGSTISYAASNPRANAGGVIPLKRGQKSSALKVIGLGANDSVTSWTSTNPKIVSVSGSGNGTCVVRAGKKTGSAVINAVTASGAAVSFRIKVQKKKVSVKSVSVSAKSVVLRPGQTYDLQAAVYPITAQGSVKCSSSKKAVATVSSGGIITAQKAGTAVITVKCGKKSTKVKVTVVSS